MEQQKIKSILEAVIMASLHPITLEGLTAVFAPDQCPETAELKQALEELTEDYASRAVELKLVATGYRFQARQDYAEWVARLWEEKAPRYSRALLETLVLIAYRQPITRAEIEDIRGVAVSTSIIKTLLEREWIREMGHRDVPGRPAIFGTTKQFLDYFNLKSLQDLPTLQAIADLDKLEQLVENHDQQIELALTNSTDEEVVEQIAPVEFENLTDLIEHIESEVIIEEPEVEVSELECEVVD